MVQREALSLQEVSSLLDVSVKTLRRWYKKGDLHATRLGPKLLRVPLDEVRRLRKRREEL
ncbi:MAG: helix-turn-helix domain-containing protein [Bryobacteraceae bacterium]